MSIRTPLLAALSLAFLFAAPTPTQADDVTKDKLARELMVLTGAGDIGKQVADGMMQQFAQNPAIPQEFADKFMEAINPDELVEMVVPLYVKAYDQATLQAAVDFYASPGGKAFTAKVPQITQESMALGQKWGVEIVTKVMKEMEAEQKAK